MKKGGGSESTIIIGPSKSVRVYALHSLEYVLGLERFRVFVLKLLYYIYKVYLYMARTPEIGQGLGRILSCGACKPEQT